MKYPKFLLLLIFVSVYSGSFAQSEPEHLINNFFKLHEERGLKKAIQYAYSTNEWYGKEAVEQVLATVDQYTATEKTGEYHGKELISAKQLGDSYRFFTYLVKYDSQPWRYEFVLYRPEDVWKLITFSIDIDFTKELEEAIDLHK